MTNISGSKANPIDWEMYENMVYLKEWTGGWVILKGSGELIYITKDGQIERKKNNVEIGSKLNPFSYTAYCKMVEIGCWPGGYIKSIQTQEKHSIYNVEMGMVKSMLQGVDQDVPLVVGEMRRLPKD